ncbi:hypothetical protein GYMLUDRAFT_36532 [Collybiopsis luxurians FD-317 M1]|nr:hypothetical protein GYMLUDRAFT_36532 [Collybiopsis luxurians FD-317 M1]
MAEQLRIKVQFRFPFLVGFQMTRLVYLLLLKSAIRRSIPRPCLFMKGHNIHFSRLLGIVHLSILFSELYSSRASLSEHLDSTAI